MLSNKENLNDIENKGLGETDSGDAERNHGCKIFSLFLRKFLSWILLIAVIIKNIHDEFGFVILTFLLFAMISFLMILSIIDWYNQIFYFKEGAIYYKSGLMNVKIREIPFQKVNTVDLSQGVMDKAFGLAKLKIDTANVSSNESELSLLLEKRRAIEIKNRILNRQNDNNEFKTSYDCYTLNPKKLMLYALTSNAIMNGIGLIFVAYTFLDDYILEVFDIKLFDEGKITTEYLLAQAIWIALAVIAVSITLSIIQSFIKYYNFKVYMDQNKLNIVYGLLNEKHYSFDRKKIKGIHSKQNLMMQFFHIKVLEIESIGYGDEKGESAILYPICDETLEREILSKLLPEFLFDGLMETSPKRALLRFIWKKMIGIAVPIGILSYYFQYGYISALLLPFVIFLGYMQYKNTATGMEKGLLSMSYNGFYKVNSVVKINAVQSFRKSYSYFQKRGKLANYTVNIFSNQRFKCMEAKNLDVQTVDSYLQKIR